MTTDDSPVRTDLAAIRRLLEERQPDVGETGKHFILWGAVIGVALVLTYASLRGVSLPIPWIWGASLGAGWVAAVWVAHREQARAPVQGLLTRVVAGTWVGCGMSATLIGVVGYFGGALPQPALPGVTAAILAAGYFATSFAYRSVWVRLAGFGWWLGAITMLAWPGEHTLLVMAGLMVVLQVLPGVLFYRQSRGQRAAPAA